MWLLDLLFPPRVDERLFANETTDSFLARMRPRAVPNLSVPTTALFPFSDPVVKAALHEAKYHANPRAYDLLSSAFSDYLRDIHELSFVLPSLVLVPIPLGAKRLRERGSNQVLEIVGRCARELDIPIEPSLLVRTRETESQVNLPRQARRENTRGAFRTARAIDPTKTYLIIDDVVTTGSTLEAANEALREGGAVHLSALALAH